MLATRHVAGRFDELEGVLGLLVPALERLHDGQVRQREVIVKGDLSPLLVITAELDESGRRVANLEQRRQVIQAELEMELGATGLRALAALADPARRARLFVLLDQLGTVVPKLREEGRRNAALLDSAAGLARRTRVTLERLSGADSLYDPRKARRTFAAQRALARPMSAPSTTAPARSSASATTSKAAATQPAATEAP